MRLIRAAAIALVLSGVPASAQSLYGDTQLSYRGGIVYDDDLVPGSGPNQSYLDDEQSGGGGSQDDGGGSVQGLQGDGGQIAGRRVNSRNLIGSDGRAVRD